MFFLKINNPEGSGTIVAAATPYNMYALCCTCGMQMKLSKRDVLENHDIWSNFYECPFCREARKEIMVDFTGAPDVRRDAEAVRRFYDDADDVDPFADDDKQPDDDDNDPDCRKRMQDSEIAARGDEKAVPDDKRTTEEPHGFFPSASQALLNYLQSPGCINNLKASFKKEDQDNE